MNAKKKATKKMKPLTAEALAVRAAILAELTAAVRPYIRPLAA